MYNSFLLTFGWLLRRLITVSSSSTLSLLRECSHPYQEEMCSQKNFKGKKVRGEASKSDEDEDVSKNSSVFVAFDMT